jgi:NTP pyrophosphatase (non-canonical NTP hydrolase)
MHDLQEQIRLFCLHQGMVAPAETRILDVVSELGEVAKEMLKASDYGKKEVKTTDDLREEMGDLLFSIIQLANAQNIDLEQEVKKVMTKYEKRIAAKGDAGSGR